MSSGKYSLGLPILAALFMHASVATAGAAASEEWLVRSAVDAPSAKLLTDELGVRIEAVEHVKENLYKVTVADSDAKALGGDGLKVVRARLSSDSVVQRVQKNFKYGIALQRNEQAIARAKALAAAKLADGEELTAEDNPPIEPVDGNPARGNDPKMGDQWGLGNARASDAWAMQRGNPDFVVAVIDTGIDYNHQDLKNNLWRNAGEIAGNNVDDDNNGYVDDIVGYDFASKDPLPYDKMSSLRIDGNPGHGTHCAGVVGAVGLNALGISGIAPNVKIMGLRFITDAGQGTSADAALAIDYAVRMGAKVISNSWGGEEGDEEDVELRNAIAAARDAGVLMIFAAGNGRNGVGYDNDTDAKPAVPASYDYDNIVSVAAIDVNNGIGAFSNWGATSVDLGAPGVKVMSSVPGNAYEDSISIFGIPLAEWSGTSMATPHVAGTAALVWSQFPSADYLEVKRRLMDSAAPIGALSGKVVTGGTLDAMAALQ